MINIGDKFGKLTVVDHVLTHKRQGYKWKLICECGQYTELYTSRLNSGHTKSCGCLNKLEKGEASFNLLYYARKSKAMKDGKIWEITKDEFRQLVSGDCYYCGVKPHRKITQKNANGEFIYNGIDRINNSVGYVLTNLRTSCFTCNQAKHSMSEYEFYEWINRVYNHLNSAE